MVEDADGAMSNSDLGIELRERDRWPPYHDPYIRLSDFVRDYCSEFVELVNTRQGLYVYLL